MKNYNETLLRKGTVFDVYRVETDDAPYIKKVRNNNSKLAHNRFERELLALKHYTTTDSVLKFLGSDEESISISFVESIIKDEDLYQYIEDHGSEGLSEELDKFNKCLSDKGLTSAERAILKDDFAIKIFKSTIKGFLRRCLGIKDVMVLLIAILKFKIRKSGHEDMLFHNDIGPGNLMISGLGGGYGSPN